MATKALKYILAIFEGYIYHVYDGMSATRYLIHSYPFIMPDRYMHSNEWPHNYVDAIIDKANTTTFPVVCIPLSISMDAPIKELVDRGYNVTVIEPLSDSTYMKCAVDSVVVRGSTPEHSVNDVMLRQSANFYYMHEEAKMTSNSLRLDKKYANKIIFITVDHSLCRFLRDLEVMEEANNIYFTNSREYAELMECAYPTYTIYKNPRESVSGSTLEERRNKMPKYYSEMVNIISPYLESDNSNRAIIFYFEDSTTIIDLVNILRAEGKLDKYLARITTGKE